MNITLKRACAAMVAAAIMLPASAFAAKIVWNYNIHGPKRAWTRTVEVAKELLEKKSNGQFELKIYYAAALGPSRENLEALKVGAIEAGLNCAIWAPSRVPLQTVLELPFILPTDTAKMAKIQHAVYQHPAVAKELAKRWRSMYWLNQALPIYESMGTKRIATVEDFKGLRIRAGGLQGSVLTDFGAVITMIHPSEVYQALEKGQIDHLTYPWTYAFGAYKLYEVSKYATIGLALGPGACISAVTLDAWKKLPQYLKDYMPEVRRIATEELFKAYAKADAKFIPIFRKRVEIVPFPAAERQKLVARAKPYWAAWAKKMDSEGRPGTELLNFTKAQVAKYR